MDDASERSANSPDDDRSEDRDGMRKQSNRACDFCHRMKMRCIGKENPPCNRCRQSGQQCTFDGPRKSKASKVEDRLKLVEEQMTVVQSSLSELITLQRAALPRRSEEPYPSKQVSFAPHPGSRSSSVSVRPSFAPDAYPHSPSSSVLYDAARQHRSPSRSSGLAPSLAPRSHTERLSHASNAGPQETPYDKPSVRGQLGSRVGETGSGVQSDDEDDNPLEPSEVIYNNMLSLAEAARLKADGHMEGDLDPPVLSDARKEIPKGRAHPFDFSLEGDDRRKRQRLAFEDPGLKRALPLQRGNHVHQYTSPIDMGFCSAEKGEELFNMFMDGAAVYMPIFDPEVDTWQSLCERSPFTITSLIMVGSKIEDAGGPPSPLQLKCKDHAETIGMHTLFTPVARIEVLQAMIVLSAWGDTSWRPGGHALRIAMDMGLYRCLPFLAESGMGAGKTAAELQDERPLIVGARCWLALYKSEFEMAFNLGRPGLFAAEETIKHARKFLEHPLSIPTDSRLVATCELLTVRMPMHQPFSIWPSATRVPDFDKRIEDANEAYHAWLKYWTDYYIRTGVPESNFLRESLLTQFSHAVLHTNSRILHGVHSRRDVALLPDSRRSQLVDALKSAETLVAMALHSQQYATNFAKANYYTHVGVAFAARMVIRLTSLLPDAVDLRQTGRDLEAVSKLLAQVPGFQFGEQVREIIVKARRKHVLPPASKPPSPTPRNAALPPINITRRSTTPGSGRDISNPAPSQSHNEVVFGTTPPEGLSLDFLYADQLFNNDTPMLVSQVGQTFEPAAPTGALVDFNLDQWFPYPPLETEPSLVADGSGRGSNW